MIRLFKLFKKMLQEISAKYNLGNDLLNHQNELMFTFLQTYISHKFDTGM